MQTFFDDALTNLLAPVRKEAADVDRGRNRRVGQAKPSAEQIDIEQAERLADNDIERLAPVMREVHELCDQRGDLATTKRT